MKSAIIVGNNEVDEQSARVITDCICDIFKGGMENKVTQLTIRHGLGTLESIICTTSTPKNVNITSCAFSTVPEEDLENE